MLIPCYFLKAKWMQVPAECDTDSHTRQTVSSNPLYRDPLHPFLHHSHLLCTNYIVGTAHTQPLPSEHRQVGGKMSKLVTALRRIQESAQTDVGPGCWKAQRTWSVWEDEEGMECIPGQVLPAHGNVFSPSPSPTSLCKCFPLYKASLNSTSCNTVPALPSKMWSHQQPESCSTYCL